MTKFKHVFSRILRLHPKPRPSFGQHAAIDPTANTLVACRHPNSLRKRTHIVPELTVEEIQSSTDTLVEHVKGPEGEGEVCKTRDVSEAQIPGLLTDSTLEVVEEEEDCHDEEDYDEFDGDDDDDVPEVFPYDLVRRTRHEMMTQRLYVAVTSDDREIAALRTLRREKFTHIVRVSFNTLSRHENITPSSWTAEELYSVDGPCELRLTSPSLTLHYDDKLTALSDRQLLAARNYITNALPGRNPEWEVQGLELPFSSDECEDSRLLIVAPSDRSVDVMAILICYLAFFTGTKADELLAGLRRLSLVNKHWIGDIVGKDTLDIADEVSRRKWKF